MNCKGQLLLHISYVLQSFPVFRDFIVIHDYLVTPSLRMQARIRKRGERGDQHMLYACVLFVKYCIQNSSMRVSK